VAHFGEFSDAPIRQFASLEDFCPLYLCGLHVVAVNGRAITTMTRRVKAKRRHVTMVLYFITVFIIYDRKQSTAAFPNRDVSNRPSRKQAHFLSSTIYCLENVNDQQIQTKTLPPPIQERSQVENSFELIMLNYDHIMYFGICCTSFIA
jgi:hypothetical protein